MKPIRVGTRGSALARTQTELVVTSLRSLYPNVDFETVIISTTGDARQNVPFAAVGEKGMFVKEIEAALLADEIAFAVHSLKDMPGELPDGLALGAIPSRADPRDALLSDGLRLSDLPPGARVGTSSPRRQAQLRAARADLALEELRGNLDTRIRRLDEGQYDAIVLACAGLERMGWAHRISERLSPMICVPAPGQGALALEVRTEDTGTRKLLTILHDQDTADAVTAERSFQAALGAGCSVPAGAYAVVEQKNLRLHAVIASQDGSAVMRTLESGLRTDAAAIGARAASRLLDQGALRKQ